MPEYHHLRICNMSKKKELRCAHQEAGIVDRIRYEGTPSIYSIMRNVHNRKKQ
jgi:hypothetical protein